MNEIIKECEGKNVYIYNFNLPHLPTYDKNIYSLPFDSMCLITKGEINNVETHDLFILSQSSPEFIKCVFYKTWFNGQCHDIEAVLNIRYENDKMFCANVIATKDQHGFKDTDLADYIGKKITRFLLALKSKHSLQGTQTKTIKVAKKKYIAKNITYITDKRYLEANRNKYPTEIEWSHCFEVCGHWRKCSSIGKNRVGDYCIPNYTWVEPHKKNKHLTEIKKVRVLS